MRSHALVVVFSLVIPMAAFSQKSAPKQPSPQAVEITAEPHHHLVLENEYVRVFSVEVAPKDATLLHRHRHDYVFVNLGNAEISNEVEGKASVKVTLQDGEAKFSQGDFAHIARNLGATPFRNIAVEFLQDAKMRNAPSNWDSAAPMKIQGGTQEILFAKDGARVSRIEMETAGFEPKHHHVGPHLVIAITDMEVRAESEDKTVSNVEMKAGEVQWVPGNITHTVTNVGSKPEKVVIIEF
jgi:beta-alanine degradation protein BauB